MIKPGLTILFFLGFLIFYIYHLPSTVQTLDTGELVTNAYHLRVSHPPGHPLYHWIYHFFTQAIPFNTVFFRAALLTTFLSLTCLILFYRSFPQTLWNPSLAMAFGLGTTSLFWKYSLLPDVFTLHLVFVSAISFIYLFIPHPTLWYRGGLLFLFALGATNHLTLVFLSPLLIHMSWRKISFKHFTILLFSSLSLFLLFYSSLFLMDDQSLTSWGDQKSLLDIWEHFLRSDYGTFQLAAAQVPEWYFFQIFAHFCRSLFPTSLLLAVLIIIFLTPLKKHAKILQEKALVYGLCLLSYIGIFFNLANINPDHFGAEVLERFYLAPLLMAFFLLAYLFSLSPRTLGPRTSLIISLLFLLTGAGNILVHQKENSFQNNTIIEDWAINRLENAGRTKKKDTILLEYSDTGLYALYYVQNVLNIRSEVTAISPKMLFHDWYARKVKNRLKNLRFNWWRTQLRQEMNLSRDLIKPNIKSFQFNIGQGFHNHIDLDQYQVTYLGLGINIHEGQGTLFDQKSLSQIKLRSDPHQLQFPDIQEDQENRDKGKFNQYLFYYSQYSYFHLARGLALYKEGRPHLSLETFQNLLQMVPFCIPAFENICILKMKFKSQDALKCVSALEKFKENQFNYF